MKKWCGVCLTTFSGEENTLPDGTIVCRSCWSRFQDNEHSLCGRFSYFCPYCKTEFDDLVVWENDENDDVVESSYTS